MFNTFSPNLFETVETKGETLKPFWQLFRYGSIWATLGLPKKFTPWSFESFSHFFLDFSKKKAKIFEI